jgi:predicted RNase H-like HicB family nuclease
MSRDYNVYIERDSAGYYIGSVPGLPGCHTQAESLDALMDRIREAIELYLEVSQDDPVRLDYVGVQKVSIST